MTYTVKQLYPQFKCLTIHRKNMKRIESAKKKVEKDMNRMYRGSGLEIDRIWEQRTFMFMFIRMVRPEEKYNCYFNMKFEPLFFEVYALERHFKEEIDTRREFSTLTEWKEHREKTRTEWFLYNQEMRAKYPFLFEKNVFDEYINDDYSHYCKYVNYPAVYLKKKLNDAKASYKQYEMDKYDRMGTFYEMMLKRDGVVGARKSLNDDVIGVINSYM